MRFEDVSFSREYRFSVGRDQVGQTYYLSIPVKNMMVDYEEYYRISEEEFQKFAIDIEAGKRFADECRDRLHDDRLILKPGRDRGFPT
jgi:hypothetical protein